jgi:transcriptional regulator with GAF, ATPase, and Fis domain
VEQKPDDGLAILVSSEGGVGVHLLPNGPCVLGRDEGCTVRVDDDSVSRRHALIHPGMPAKIEDLGSRNGTTVAGRRLAKGERCPIPIGTVVELGSATIVVQRAAIERGALAPRKPSPLPAGVLVRDATMERLYGMLDVVAPSMLTVLVLGETGVGKEVYAETIHRRSPRADKPFLALNCAAIAESLLESELFGHEKGAFTGALQVKVGLFEAADGGTVLLDEVGELPLGTQAKLLRVLEKGEVMRVGSVTPRRVDVRFVAATNRDLRALSTEGAFRSDLFFRLNGVTVTLPPLRSRPDDVEGLAERFAGASRLSPQAIARLRAHTWPGNVRELRNVVERSVLLARGGVVEPEHLLIDEAAPLPPVPAPTPAVHAAPPAEVAGLRDELEAVERERIRAALAKCDGHQGRAAELLGISRRTLIARLDQYGFERPRKKV